MRRFSIRKSKSFKPEPLTKLFFLMKKLLVPLLTTLLFMVCEKEQVKSVPELLSPSNGVILDNSCEDLSNEMTWEFDWEDFPGASRYHLFVMHRGSAFPAINSEIVISEFTSTGTGGYIVDQNLTNWFWRVRAFVDGNWTEWSEERSFKVEPLNTDC